MKEITEIYLSGYSTLVSLPKNFKILAAVAKPLDFGDGYEDILLYVEHDSNEYETISVTFYLYEHSCHPCIQDEQKHTATLWANGQVNHIYMEIQS